MSFFEWNIIHMFKFKPGTVEKSSSTIGTPAGIGQDFIKISQWSVVPQNRYDLPSTRSQAPPP